MSSELYSKYPSDSGSTQGIQDESGAARLLKLPLALALKHEPKIPIQLAGSTMETFKRGQKHYCYPQQSRGDLLNQYCIILWLKYHLSLF